MKVNRHSRVFTLSSLTVPLIISCASTKQLATNSPAADQLKKPVSESRVASVQKETTKEAAFSAQEPSPLGIYEDFKLVSNIYYETDIREVLMDFASQAGVSILPGPMVQGYYVSAEFQMVPLKQALFQLLSPLGLSFTEMDGYFFVGKASPDSPSFHLVSTVELITPNYLKAENVPRLLSSFYEPYIKVVPEDNMLAINAAPEMIKKIKEEIAKIDLPPRQIMIEALMTEFSEEARKSLGIETGLIGSKDGQDLSVIFPVGDLLDNTLGIWYQKPDRYEGWLAEYQVSLKALIQDGEVQVRANPRVATLEGQKATIYVGREEYYVIVTGVTPYYYGQLERIKVGVSLSIIPYVSENNEITVEIEPEVSDVIGKGATDLPVVSKRAVTTKIRVKEGETIVIGGLLQNNEKTTRRKIPFLGDIPILGYLFSRTDKEVEETETVIFITPHIIRETSER